MKEINSGVCVKKKSLAARVKGELWRNRYLYLLAVPVVAYYIIFCYMPMFGLTIAFKDYQLAKGVFASDWVGLKYFKEFFSGIFFKRTLINTLLISFYDLLFGFPMPIIFALMINQLKNAGFKRVVQTATYLPHFISTVVVCGMIVDFFSNGGAISQALQNFGGADINYIGSEKYFRPIYILTNIWQSIGWNSIIYLSALASVDVQLYEAAEIDGAGWFKQLIHITLPGIMNTVIIMLILRIGQLLSVGYEKIILLYSPATYGVADVISSYVYRMGISSSRYSYSAAVGLFQSVVNVILLVTANTFSKKYSETALF